MMSMKSKKNPETERDDVLTQVRSHYDKWSDDVEKRLTRTNGWNDITDAYYGKLPSDWPFVTRIVDPRIKTALLEKNARLTNSKLKGRFIPREGGDVLGAKLNSAVIDFQWDMACGGGSMQSKISVADMDTRLYGIKFGLAKWRCVYGEDGKIEYEGNDYENLDIRDCGMDWSTHHVKDAKWFQHRTWEKLEDLDSQVGPDGKPVYKNLDKIKGDIYAKGVQLNSEKRSIDYTRRVLEIRGLEDRASQDLAYPIVEIVTEYRKDRWITFAPSHGVVLRDIPNPYEHGKLPIVQLRYYDIQDDPYGESEVEPVLPLWWGIQATVCSYMDEVMLKMRPPLKIVENLARIETIVYGPEAQWMVSDINAIQEMQSNGDSLRYFQTTYSALVSAFNNAMGGLSQGTSVSSPFESDKTATEIKASVRQQNVRDQKNQSSLVEFIKDIIELWQANNRQFLFSDEKKQQYVLKIVGRDMFEEFKRMGLADMELTPQASQMIADIVAQQPEITDDQLRQLVESGSTPKYPVYENPNEKDPTKIKYGPKMVISDQGSIADIYITPEDLEGKYDYVPDVQAMSSSASDDLKNARQQAFQIMTSPVVLQLLEKDGFAPDVKEILTGTLEDLNLKDAEKYFKQIGTNATNTGPVPGTPEVMPNAGIPGVPQADIAGGLSEQMAGPVTV